MSYTRTTLYLILVISIIEASHFRGGFVTWQAVSPIPTNSTTITINIQQTYGWAYSRYPCGLLIGDANYLMCISSNCSNYNSSLPGTQTPCISYDLSLGVSTGQSITSITLTSGAQLVLAYSSGAWLQLVSSSSASWSLITSIDLRIRNDNGRINSSPTSSIPMVITVPVAVQQTLRVPIVDVDFDIVKCRWANNTAMIGSTVIDECSGVCQNIPGAQLYLSSNTDNNCTIVFTVTLAGYYVVALQIEDFSPSAPGGSPRSSSPLQFLVLALNVSCNPPIIIGQLPNGATIGVEANKVFTMHVFAQPGCNTTVIDHFLSIILPSGVVNITTVASIGIMLYTITLTWTPSLNPIGSTQTYCTMAADNNTLQSAEYCLNFIVFSDTTTSTTTATTQLVTATTTQLVTSTQTTNNLSFGLALGLDVALLLLFGSLLICACCWWYAGF